jgi:hypothetical protein
MRPHAVLAIGVAVSAAAPWVSACGSQAVEADNVQSIFYDAAPPQSGFGDTGGQINVSTTFDASVAEASSADVTIIKALIVPANASLSVTAGQVASQTFTVVGTLGDGTEQDITSRFVFYVPDNYLVGGFPTSGAPTFTTTLPSSPADPPQRGGTLTVLATALNPGDEPFSVSTSFTVQLKAALEYPPATTDSGVGDGSVLGDDASADAQGDGSPDASSPLVDPIPANAASLFSGPPGSQSPGIAYPNDGVMLPPNLRLLDVHWTPGSPAYTLYAVHFTSSSLDLTYYTRCADLGGLLVQGACGFQLDETGYNYLAQSSAGQGGVTVTVQGTDDSGTSVGTSSPITIQFAQESVNGGVYYWDVTHTRIMRFDFGGTSTTPEVFLSPGDYGTSSGLCIGCHALSPDGTKLAASAGGQGNGYLVYVDGVAAPTTPLTAAEDQSNRIQFASFSPLGDLFVAVYGDGAPLTPDNLYFHDGVTGVINHSLTKALSFEPDHPAWSPDGTMIAMTHVGVHNTSQMEFLGGIDVAQFSAGAVGDAGIAVGDGGSALADPFVVIPSNIAGVNNYNPSFAPDSTFLVFTRTTCDPSVDKTNVCDSDISSNVTATTWAVVPQPNATPVHLDRAAAPGVADGVPANILDTFPRSTPFETNQGTGKLFWFTVASLRQPGLRYKQYQASDESFPAQQQQQLWMFAVDPAAILAGNDGSYPAFFLPFQDPTTSNHIGQWTQKIVSANAPPPAPSPPPPPPAPAPPPPPR